MSESPGGQRAKRLKVDKHGRMSALEKLRQLKGSKRKYEVEEEVENVYDTVDEEEYSERVLQRQEHDWIEDDDGCGYVEDGREIFDDDEIEDTYSESSGRKDGSSRGQKRKARVAAGAASGKGNIRNLLGNMPAKKKEEIKTSDDSILSDIMSDLDSTPGTSVLKPKIMPTSKINIADTGERDAKNYFKNLSSNTKKTAPTSFLSHQPAPVQVKTEIDNKPIDNNKTFEKISPVKTKWNILKDIKEEKDENTPTQQIEEFNTQDYNFDDGDFDNGDLEDETKINDESVKKIDDSAKRIAELVKKSDEPVKENGESVKKERKDSIGSNMDGVNVEAFLDDDFEIFGNTKAEIRNKGEPAVKSENVPTKMWSGQNDTPIIQTTSYDSSTLPLHTNESGEKVLRFYWWDAWEDRFVKPGVVYLFGKVYTDPNNTKAGCVSCCLIVKNVMRKLFLLPREYKLDPNTQQEDPDNQNSIRDVYNEFNSRIADKIGIKEFKSRPVSRNYAFNLPSVPAQSEYLEVKYEATYPPPPTDKQYQTIAHIFGTNTSSLETFLLERKVKGPCWLEVRNPENVQAKVSWCKMEVACARMEDVSVLRTDHNLKPPPLVVATLNMRTAMDQKTRRTKIVMLSCLVHNNFEIHKPAPNPPFQTHFCVFTRCNDIWPIDLKQAMSQYKATRLTKCDSERELLNYFLVQFWKLDADLVLGHDLQGFQQDLLIGNVLDLNIPNWSRLGRLKRSVVPQRKYISKDAFLGRLVCDIKLSAMELIRSRSYDLDMLCTSVLKVKEAERKDIVPEELQRYYENGRDLMHLVSLTMQDTSYIAKIMCELNVLPLALQITQIAGNVMSRTLMGGRSERNEFLLLHAFTEKDYVVPDKEFAKKAIEEKNTVENEDGDETNVTNVSKKQARKKPAYSGGLVLEPKKGFYDKLVLLMDFNSLYPSIIQEYNICFTTVKRDNNITSDEDIAKMVLPDTKTEQGVLPTQIRRLVESRREVKKLMKTPDLSVEQYMQYNIRQLALKLTANSMYGCLGFTHSRFYAKPLAALITMKGREILMDTQDIVQRLNYEVIYGDTDSLMINTNCLDYDQVFKIGHELKKEINKKYKQIELDIDGVFRYLLLLKKKKYAAVLLSRNKNGEFVTTQEHKGLDIVRRDWSQLAAEAGKFILSQILSEQNADDRIESIQTHLVNLKEDILENRMPLSMLTITKQLTKNPDEYADKNGQPHVQVALRLNSKNARRFKKGDVVPYLICVDGTPNPPTQRAYHIEELKNSETLKVDVNYYLAQQLHPVISRICDPIEGMDAARIADCLGLDPSGYKHAVKRDNNTNDEYEIENEKEKYRYCKDFVYTCYKCKSVNKIHDTFVKIDKETVTFLEKCQGENCKLAPVDCLYRIQNELSRQIREYISIYYDNYLICEDPACTNRTARLPQSFVAGYPLCQLCQKGVMYREYTEKDLYLQINFFHYLFDLNKQNISKIRVPPHVTSAFHTLKEMVEDALTHSGYSVIDLSVLFRFFVLDKNSEKEENNVMEVDVTPETEQRDACLEMGAAVGDAYEEV